HGEIVRAVADGQRGRERDRVRLRQFVQGALLGVAVEDRLGDGAGERGAVVEQHVRAVRVEAHQGCDAAGEEGEAAGDQGGERAVRAHGGDQGGGARRQARALTGLLQRVQAEAAQHRDALAQGGGEVELAVHAAAGDGGDAVLQPGEVGELVERLRGDDGAVHVGEQQALAPVGTGRLGDGVDGGAGEGGVDGVHVGRRGGRDVGGLGGG